MVCDSKNVFSRRFEREAIKSGIFTVGSLYEPPVENGDDFYRRFVPVTIAINVIFTEGLCLQPSVLISFLKRAGQGSKGHSNIQPGT